MIYAIYDKLAEDIIGGLHLHNAEATAIRWFADIVTDKRTAVAQHPDDYELQCLGSIDRLHLTSSGPFQVITATAIAASAAAAAHNQADGNT